MNKKFASLMVCVFLLTGCEYIPWFKKKPPTEGGKPTASAQLGAASTAATNAQIVADDSLAREKEQNRKLLSGLKANVDSAKEFNSANPDGTPKTKVDGELSVAQGRLSTVEADQAELANARARALLVEQGKTAEARAAYERAAQQGKDQAAALARAEAATQQAIKERDEARANELREIEEYKAKMADNQKEFDRRLRQAQNETLIVQVRGLNIASIACLVLFGLGIGFGGPAGLKMTWPFGVISALCFGLAQLISQWWFMYACGAAALIGLGCAGWWVWKHYKLGTLQKDANDKATQFSDVLTQIVPVLDKAYESANEDVKKVLDETIFQPMSNKMNREEKSLVHSIRAKTS